MWRTVRLWLLRLTCFHTTIHYKIERVVDMNGKVWDTLTHLVCMRCGKSRPVNEDDYN